MLIEKDPKTGAVVNTLSIEFVTDTHMIATTGDGRTLEREVTSPIEYAEALEEVMFWFNGEVLDDQNRREIRQQMEIAWWVLENVQRLHQTTSPSETSAR